MSVNLVNYQVEFEQKVYWINGSGNRQEISEMDTDYILNCIRLMQDRINTLEAVAFVSKTIDQHIKDLNNSIEVLVVELNSREV